MLTLQLYDPSERDRPHMSQHEQDALEPTAPTRLHVARPFIPAAFLVAYTLLILAWKYLTPRSIKRKIDVLIHDPVTIDDIPYAEPIRRKLPLKKVLLKIIASTARLGIEIFLLVQACLRRDYDISKAEVTLYSCYVALWVGLMEDLVTHAMLILTYGMLISFLKTLLTIHAVFSRKPTPHYGLLLFYLLDIVASWSNHLTAGHLEAPRAVLLDIILRLARLVPSVVLLGILLSLPMSPFLPTPKTAVEGCIASRAYDSPEDGTTLLSWLLVDWLNPLLTLARQRTLQDEDVYQLSPYFQHAIIYPVFQAMKQPTFMRKMYAFTAFDLIIGSICSLTIAVLTFVGPFFLKNILEALASDSPELRNTAYKLAFLAFVLNIVKACIEVFRQWHGRRAYERCRGILIMMVFDKAMRRKDTSGSVGHRKADKDEQDVAGSDAGGILNMMNGDA